MNILNIEHIHKIFGDKVIFDDISCGIDQGEKIGIIGVNGTGKTTLLRVIAGEEEPDEGQVITQNGIRISWLPQTPEFPQHMTILDYVAEGKWQKDWSTESEARRMLNTLGITDQNINMDNLSGGEKKRVALARMLLNPADILILDEPTNHLDGEMVTWLEDFLRGFRGTVIMVTHDRYFLDRVANRILEISHGKLYSYAGDYSKFLELKAQREEMELASDRKRRSVLRMELEWAARGCRARSTKQRARLDRLEALKAGKTPVKDSSVEMDSIETRMGKKTVEFHHVSKAIEGRMLISDFDEMDMSINTAGCNDHSFSCQCLCGCSDSHSRCHTIHDIRVSGFTDSCDLTIFDSDICLDDSCGIYNQGIGDNKIQITVTAAGFYRLSHSVTDGFTAAEFYFIAICGVIFLNLHYKAGVCKSYFVTSCRAVHHCIFFTGNFYAHLCPSL